ncbi:MAG: hypothetical protein R2737_14830 [Candidatus Nanopelagicales bacterium]
MDYVDAEDSYLPAALAFPRPIDWFSGSVGNLTLARIIGVDTPRSWIQLHVVLVAAAIAAGLILASRARLTDRATTVLVLFSATATPALLWSVGRYDPLTYVGACLIVLVPSRSSAVLGALVMALGNPEQAVVACAALLILSGASAFRDWRRVALTALATSGTVWLAVQLWLSLNGVGRSRLTVLPEYLGASLHRAMDNPATFAWSWLGVGWLLVLALLVVSPGWSRLWIGASVIGLPALATVLTLDGARVYGMAVLPAYLVAGCHLFRAMTRDSARSAAIGLYAILWIITPVLASPAG